jgi:purine-nucleoside phosphorylase
MFSKINESANFLRSKGMNSPEIGIILGTGLGKLADLIEKEIEIDYEDIPHFPISTVEFHHGILIYGKLRGKTVIVMKGRSHAYEGYTTQEITFPVRVMKVLGIRSLLVSNAGGAMNTSFKKGTLMLIEDHINLLPNPLIGPNIDELGTRFPDMSQAYSKEISGKIVRIAEKHGVTLHKGVYVAVTGPSLETRAEYRFLNRIGADVVGMSTTPEVIVANHMKLPVAAISVVTDECDPDNLESVDIDKILYYASQAEKGLVKIFSDLVEEL